MEQQTNAGGANEKGMASRLRACLVHARSDFAMVVTWAEIKSEGFKHIMEKEAVLVVSQRNNIIR